MKSRILDSGHAMFVAASRVPHGSACFVREFARWTNVMRFSLLLLTLITGLNAAEISAADKLTAQALARLDKRINHTFTIPFPKDFDIDVHLKQPVALIPVDAKKVCATRPRLNPYDGEGTIEWLLGPDDPVSLPKENILCMLHLDERGDFLQIGLLGSPDIWPAGDKEGHQMFRREGESGADFFQRALFTYRIRTQRAKDPALAVHYLAAFEKIAVAIQTLRKEEERAARE